MIIYSFFWKNICFSYVYQSGAHIYIDLLGSIENRD